MVPDDSQLLAVALGAVRQARKNPQGVDLAAMLGGLDTTLNELLLRGQSAFYSDFIRQGEALAAEAEALSGKNAHPPAKTHETADATAAIIARNAALVLALGDLGGDAANTLVARIVEWELQFYARRNEIARPELSQDPLEQLTAGNFELYLRSREPRWQNARVTEFRRQPGGYSKITVLVTVEGENGEIVEYVIRAEPARKMLDLDGMAIASEFPVVQFAYRAGLPVAEPILLETDKAHLGMPFMLSRRMGGKVLGSFTGSEQAIEESLVRKVLALIARIANTRVDREDSLIRSSHLKRWLDIPDLAQNTRAFIEYWRDVAVQGNATPSPLLNYACDWLLANVPEDDEAQPVLIHGDVGFHNILFEGDRLTALLDWENARWGDVAEELSMFIPTVSGMFPYEQILDWYHEAGGPRVTPWRLRYFDVYMAMKIVVAAQVSLQRVEETPEGSLHLAVFGLSFLHPIGSRLPELIAMAEAAKSAEVRAR